MTFGLFRERAAWLSQITCVVFLVVSAYVQGKSVFWGGCKTLGLVAAVAALLTLLLGALALPRWQGFVALAVSAYAVYWMSGPICAIP
jgi:hypothetical protein